MKKISNSSRLALALLTVLAGYGSSKAATIYVDDSWGAAPTRSHATIPYEDAVEDRIWYNPQNNTYALAAGTEDGVANGPDWVITGLKNIEYFPLAASYNVAVPATIDDPTTAAVEADALTLGTNAVASMKAAFLSIAAAPAGTYDKIVVLPGTYFEAVFIPNNTLNNATANAYYGVANSSFYGKFQANFTITAAPDDKPVFTRGMVMDSENSSGMTISNLHLAGIPGTNGNGVPLSTSNRIVAVNGGSKTLAYPGTTTAGVRQNLKLSGLVFDGKQIRIPFVLKVPLNTTYFPGYTTLPANNNAVGAGGGRGGIVLNGEYGSLTVEDCTFRGIRSFWNFDTNNATNTSATWTTFIAQRNTLEDCWGNFAIRGEDPNYVTTAGATQGQPVAGARQPAVGVADEAIIVNNTVRDMGEGVLQLMDVGTTGSNNFLLDHAPNSGAAFKVFNVRDLRFENNTVTRVNIMQDWFAKPNPPPVTADSKVPPGAPGFIPMGGGLILRDFRWSGLLPVGQTQYGPWADLSTVTVKGNLFEYCQQGIGFDTASSTVGGGQRFIPAGIITANRFYNNRTAVYFYDSYHSSQSLSFTDNILEEPNADPFNTGIGATADNTLVGGLVFDDKTGTLPESAPIPPLDLSDNYYGGGAPAITTQSPTFTAADVVGEQPGEFETVYVNPDPDADGIASINEDANGNNSVDPGETDPNDADTDNDGLNDGLELRLGYDPTNAASPSATADADNDNVPDAVEALLGTNPNSADSDGDGIRDDYEIQIGTNALAADSIPSDFGDTNGDGNVDNVDATAILEAFLDLSVLNVTNADKVDINRDGKVDNVDAIIVFNFQVGNIPYIPFP